MKGTLRITAFPQARPWFTAGRQDWLNRFACLCGSGRAALYWGLRSLGLPAGTPAWMPSYHCGVEVDAAIHAGFDPKFYKVNENLSIDEGDLSRRIERSPGPVLMVHYFGFPQPCLDRIAELCRVSKCFLIEDCAHALFSSDESGRETGTVAPMSIYSLRKTLPVVDGGALRVGGNLAIQPKLDAMAMDAYRVYLKNTIRGIAGQALTDTYRKLRWRDDGRATYPSGTGDVFSHAYTRPLSSLSRIKAGSISSSEVIDKRRENYRRLHEALTGAPGYRPLWGNLPAGMCPLFLPVSVGRRDWLMKRMADGGVETFRFGASSAHRVDGGEFRETLSLRNQLLCLPIHQDLGVDEIKAIAGEFARALAESERRTQVPTC